MPPPRAGHPDGSPGPEADGWGYITADSIGPRRK